MVHVLVALLVAQTPVVPDREVGVPIGKGTTLPKVELTAPPGGWTVNRMMLVEGTVSDATVDPVTLSINGDRYLLRTHNGRFSRKFPAASGKNVVTVLATNKAGTAKAQTTCYAQVSAVPLKAVLTSDTDGVWTDLHLYEPTDRSTKDGKLDLTSMAHVYWANTESPSGGTFYLNEQGGDFDQPGYGPYLYIHRAPPKGLFLIATNYWPSGDKAHAIATLNLAMFEGTPNEIRRKATIPLATPGTTKVLAWVNVLAPDRAQVWIPSSEPKPQGWPDGLQETAEKFFVAGFGAEGDY